MRTCKRCGNGIGHLDPRAVFCSDNCRKHQHESERGADCMDCGAVITRSSVKKGATRCRLCWERTERKRIATRDLRIAAMWLRGATWGEIGEAMGWDHNRMAHEMNRIRQRSPELLPYRRTPEQVERIRAGRWGERQVA